MNFIIDLSVQQSICLSTSLSVYINSHQHSIIFSICFALELLVLLQKDYTGSFYVSQNCSSGNFVFSTWKYKMEWFYLIINSVILYPSIFLPIYPFLLTFHIFWTSSYSILGKLCTKNSSLNARMWKQRACSPYSSSSITKYPICSLSDLLFPWRIVI